MTDNHIGKERTNGQRKSIKVRRKENRPKENSLIETERGRKATKKERESERKIEGERGW